MSSRPQHKGTLRHRRVEGILGILHDREPAPILHRPKPRRAVIRCTGKDHTNHPRLFRPRYFLLCSAF
jgi:hypothetical protein